MLKSAIITIICIFTVATSSGCIDNPFDDENHWHPTSVMLSTLWYNYSNPDDNSTLDVELLILKISPRETKIRWDDVYLNITDWDGNRFLIRIPIEAQSPSDDTEFHAIYTDHGPNMDRMDPNDTILFIGVDERFAGASLDLIWNRQGNPEMIGETRIPSKLVVVTFVSVDERIEDAATWYDLHFQLDLTFSPGTTLKWNDCRIEVGYRNNRHGNIPMKTYPIVAGGTIEAWYKDTNFANTTLDDGDMITLSGLTIAYQDGWMQIEESHVYAGDLRLPSQF